MAISRRILLAAPLLAAAAPAPKHGGNSVRLRPGGPAVPFRLTVHPMATGLSFAGFRESFALPGEASVLGTYPIAGRELLGIGFDASALAGVTQKLCALIGWDGRTLRILGVETLAFSSGDNGSQSTLKATLGPGDATHLRLSVEASRAEHGKAAHHESWTDLLAWREGAPLTTADPGKSAGPWQTRADATRARVAALLTPARTKLTLDMLDPTGLLDPLGSSPQ